MRRSLSLLCSQVMSKDPAYRLLLDECCSLYPSPQLHLGNAFVLMEQDHTVPFIARYRREMTGDMPANDLYELKRRWDDFVGMVKSRTTRLATLESSGKITPDIRSAFYQCISKEELDELYASFKETKTTKSQIVASLNLDSIVDQFLAGRMAQTNVSADVVEAAGATKYTVTEAIAYLCAARIANDIDVKGVAKEQFTRYPTKVSTSLTPSYKSLLKGSGGDKRSAKITSSNSSNNNVNWGDFDKYRDYHSISSRRVTQFAAHQLLALRRGKEAGVIAITLSPDDAAKQNILGYINKKYKHYPSKNSSSDRSSSSASDKDSRASSSSNNSNNKSNNSIVYRSDVLSDAGKEVVTKLCASWTKKQWKDAILRAEIEASEVFGTSLRPLLLTAPLRCSSTGGSVRSTGTLNSGLQSSASSSQSSSLSVVCAVDPGFSHGHKWVILNTNTASSTGSSGGNSNSGVLSYGKIFAPSNHDAPSHQKQQQQQQTQTQHTNNSSSSSSSSRLSPPPPVMIKSVEDFVAVLEQYKVNVVAIGNGTGCREAQSFVSSALQCLWGRSSSTSTSTTPGTTSRIEADRKGGEEGRAVNSTKKRKFEAQNLSKVIDLTDNNDGSGRDSKKSKQSKLITTTSVQGAEVMDPSGTSSSDSLYSSSSGSSSGGSRSLRGVGAAGGYCHGYVVVSEAGASVYSASECARQEFSTSNNSHNNTTNSTNTTTTKSRTDTSGSQQQQRQSLDIAYLGAVSIGRRLVDPLSELVKVEPHALGVGMYQHDLSDRGIAERLRDVVEDCVNCVGVDVNTASAELLHYVSGLNDAHAKELLNARGSTSSSSAAAAAAAAAAGKLKKQKGQEAGHITTKGGGGHGFQNLAELLSVKGIGTKTFQNCAGFLRVYNGSEPLDATNVHPDDYPIAKQILAQYRNQSTAGLVQLGEEGEDRLPDFLTSATVASSGSEEKKGKKEKSSLYANKTEAELRQIWNWLVEAQLITLNNDSNRNNNDGTMKDSGPNFTHRKQQRYLHQQGPFMSFPKILREMPSDLKAPIQVGSTVDGVIRNVTTFGAFVDLGGNQILIQQPTSLAARSTSNSSSSSAAAGGGARAAGAAGAALTARIAPAVDGLLHVSKYKHKFATHDIYVGRSVRVQIVSIEPVSVPVHTATTGSTGSSTGRSNNNISTSTNTNAKSTGIASRSSGKIRISLELIELL